MNATIPNDSDTILMITALLSFGLEFLSWLLLSLGFTALLGKLRKKGRWMGWIPGLR